MTVVLPKGSKLFHGTLEPLKGGLLPGEYDQVLWFGDNAGVAQLYIPRGGGSFYKGSEGLAQPSRDSSTQQVQRMVGLNFDPGQVEWDEHGKLRSYRLPDEWSEFNKNLDKMSREIELRLEKLGYAGTGLLGSRTYHFYSTNGKILPPGGKSLGTLCVATTLRDMTLWEKALGEGDLTEVQYHDVGGFRRAQEKFDGVIIDDFAQSEEWGNLGHLSVGLFGPALKDIKTKCIPATYEEWNRSWKTEAWPHESRPYFHTLLTKANPRSSKLKRKMMR